MGCNQNRNVWSICLPLIVTVLFMATSRSAAAGSVVTANAQKKKKSLDPIQIHGWLMYAAMGFFLPAGMIVVRLMKQARKSGEKSAKRLRVLYYLHLSIQTAGVIAMTGGAIYSFKKFGYNFRHTHQRLGLCLFILVWLQSVVGFLRPNRGVRVRPIWYGIHWLLGTAAIILGFINLYIGMKIYEMISKTSIRTLNIIFSVQLSIMALLYLVQDRWDYLVEQGQLISKPIVPFPVVKSGPLYSQVPTTMEYQMRHYLPS